MRWHDKEIDNPKVFDSKELSEDTQKINLALLNERLAEEEKKKEDYVKEYKEYEAYLKKQKSKRAGILAIIFIVVIVVGVVISFVAFKKYTHVSDMENEAEIMLDEHNYQRAADLYKKLYEETDEVQYIQKYKLIASNIENKKMFEEADKYVAVGDYEEAIEVLLSIHTENDTEADKVNNKITDISNKWLENIRKVYLDGNVSFATTEINKFVNIMPDSISGSELRSMILNKSGDEKIVNYRTSKNRETMVQKNASEIKRMYDRSRSIIGTDQIIKIDNSSVREKPEKESKVINTLKNGTSVYIQDIYISGTSNIWCKVQYHTSTGYKLGWISYNMIVPVER